MKAIRISVPVGVDGLVYGDAPDPKPAIGDVLVEVHACGFTASELFWPLYTDRAGRDRTPLIPGHEFSGVVVGLGYGTAGMAVGDEVYGLIDGYRDGVAAELIAIVAGGAPCRSPHRHPTIATTSARSSSFASRTAPELVEITRLVDAGNVRPQVGAVYPLAEAREAFTAKSVGGIPGRVVLRP